MRAQCQTLDVSDMCLALVHDGHYSRLVAKGAAREAVKAKFVGIGHWTQDHVVCSSRHCLLNSNVVEDVLFSRLPVADG